MNKVDVAYVLIVDELEQQVLMALNTDNNLWTLPGGAVESGETLIQAAAREALEEAGVIVEIGPLVSVNECILTKLEARALFFTFRASLLAGEPHIVRPDEIGAVEWVDICTANEYLTYHPGDIQALMRANCPCVDEGVR